MLTDKGIRVEQGMLDEKGKWLNRRFFLFHQKKRPYVILKWAQTQNGFFAPADRSRIQLTDVHTTQLVHKWRTEEAAIMVGYNTALNDDPQLTARNYQGKQPLRILLDRELKLPPTQKIFDQLASTWVISEQKEEIRDHIRYLLAVFDNKLINNILLELYKENIQSIIIEGGAQLLQNFIESDLWDEARILTAPVTLNDGLPAPLLLNANLIFATQIVSDRLDVYTHQNNPFTYVEGMNL
jgi:diaminohydroxyphosphoribosylaminopyrimidine deaminase/5-amino-6-(5-phosphoribosylamino)uracil reductase